MALGCPAISQAGSEHQESLALSVDQAIEALTKDGLLTRRDFERKEGTIDGEKAGVLIATAKNHSRHPAIAVVIATRRGRIIVINIALDLAARPVEAGHNAFRSLARLAGAASPRLEAIAIANADPGKSGIEAIEAWLRELRHQTFVAFPQAETRAVRRLEGTYVIGDRIGPSAVWRVTIVPAATDWKPSSDIATFDLPEAGKAALRAYDAGDFAEVRRLVQQPVSRGEPWAEVLMADTEAMAAVMSGEVPALLDRYRAAARRGYAPAQFRLGLAMATLIKGAKERSKLGLMQRKDLADGLVAAARQGHIHALGVLFHSGVRLAGADGRDHDKALKCLGYVAEMGDSVTLRNVTGIDDPMRLGISRGLDAAQGYYWASIYLKKIGESQGILTGRLKRIQRGWAQKLEDARRTEVDESVELWRAKTFAEIAPHIDNNKCFELVYSLIESAASNERQ